MEPILLRRFGILLSLLILEVSSSTADTNGTTRYPTCNYNTTFPTLAGIVKSSMKDVLYESMQDVLSEFFTEDFLNNLRPNSESDANQNQTEGNHTSNLFAGCPIGWFRILDSCLWVSPKDMKLNHDSAYMHCSRKIPGGKLLEPLSTAHNDFARNLIDAFDETNSAWIWIGINDIMEENRFVYTKSGMPILFENWNAGQPNGKTTENCIVQHPTSGKWYDRVCANTYRFICEKYLN